eukprot:scaffold326_cov169-Ochromonas_danica.AAC.22
MDFIRQFTDDDDESTASSELVSVTEGEGEGEVGLEGVDDSLSHPQNPSSPSPIMKNKNKKKDRKEEENEKDSSEVFSDENNLTTSTTNNQHQEEVSSKDENEDEGDRSSPSNPPLGETSSSHSNPLLPVSTIDLSQYTKRIMIHEHARKKNETLYLSLPTLLEASREGLRDREDRWFSFSNRREYYPLGIVNIDTPNKYLPSSTSIKINMHISSVSDNDVVPYNISTVPKAGVYWFSAIRAHSPGIIRLFFSSSDPEIAPLEHFVLVEGDPSEDEEEEDSEEEEEKEEGDISEEEEKEQVEEKEQEGVIEVDEEEEEKEKDKSKLREERLAIKRERERARRERLKEAREQKKQQNLLEKQQQEQEVKQELPQEVPVEKEKRLRRSSRVTKEVEEVSGEEELQAEVIVEEESEEDDVVVRQALEEKRNRERERRESKVLVQQNRRQSERGRRASRGKNALEEVVEEIPRKDEEPPQEEQEPTVMSRSSLRRANRAESPMPSTPPPVVSSRKRGRPAADSLSAATPPPPAKLPKTEPRSERRSLRLINTEENVMDQEQEDIKEVITVAASGRKRRTSTSDKQHTVKLEQQPVEEELDLNEQEEEEQEDQFVVWPAYTPDQLKTFLDSVMRPPEFARNLTHRLEPPSQMKHKPAGSHGLLSLTNHAKGAGGHVIQIQGPAISLPVPQCLVMALHRDKNVISHIFCEHIKSRQSEQKPKKSSSFSYLSALPNNLCLPSVSKMFKILQERSVHIPKHGDVISLLRALFEDSINNELQYEHEEDILKGISQQARQQCLLMGDILGPWYFLRFLFFVLLHAAPSTTDTNNGIGSTRTKGALYDIEQVLAAAFKLLDEQYLDWFC